MKTSVVEVRAMLSVWSVDEVERRIGEVPGVESVTVNHAAGSATVRYDETRLEIADIKASVRQRGYESAAPVAASAGDVHEGAPATPGTASTGTARQEKAVPAAPAPDTHKGHAAPGARAAMPADMAYEMGHGGKDLPAMVRDMRNRFWICLIFSVPIFVYAPMGSFFEPPTPPFGLELDRWLFFLASAAILYPSWTFVVSAWRALRTGTLSMAVLVVLSVGTGYLFSVGSTFFFKGGGQFFEAAAVLLVFILLGHWLEMRARAGASSAIKALMNLTPAKASVIRNGAEVEVPTAEVLAGEIVVVVEDRFVTGAEARKESRTELTGRRPGAVIEGMAHSRARGLAFAVMLVLTASGTTRGSCFMPGAGETGLRDAHACCRHGWTARPPECCMAGASGEDPAWISVTPPLAGPPPAVAVCPDMPRAGGARAVLRPSDRSHSPPGRVPLRI